MKDLKKIQEFFSKPLKEAELKLGVKYELPNGDTGYIMTGGSNDPKDWIFSDGFKKVPYFSVKKELKPLATQPGKYDGAFDLGLGKGHHIDERMDDEDFDSLEDAIANREFGMDYNQLGPNEKEWVRDEMSMNEMDMNDPVMVRMRAAKMKASQPTPEKTTNPNYPSNKNAKKLAFLKKERAQLMRDMEQEAEPEGGPIANEYGNKLNRIDAAIAKLSGRKEMTYDQAIAEGFKDYLGYSSVEVSRPTQDQVDRFFALTQNETHYLNSKPVEGQEKTFNKMEVEPWDEYDLSNWNSLVRKAKYQEMSIDEGQVLKGIVDGKPFYIIDYEGQEMRIKGEDWPKFKEMIQLKESLDEGNDKIKDLEQLFDFHTQMDNKGRASIIKDKIEKLRKLSNSGEIDGDEFLDKFNPLQKQLKSIDEASRARVSMPRFVKDKNNPNFLNVYIDYDLGPGGSSIALGKETMTGQIRRESAAEAMRLASDVARDLEAEYNLEDIDIQDLENGKVRIFAVSDDFINMNPNMLGEIKESLNPEVSNAVNRFIKAMAKRYDYSEQDAVYAIMAALKQRDFDGLNEDTRKDLGMSSSVSKSRAKAELKNPGNDGSKVYGLDKDGKRVHIKNINDVDKFTKFELDADLNEAKEEDKIDIVTMDVPLFIRALEYAKEDAQEDMDLHDFAEKAIAATKEQGILQMDDYDMLVGDKEPIDESVNLKQSKLSSSEYQKAKKLKAFDAKDWKWNADEDLYIKVVNESVVEKVIAQLKEAKPGLWANINAKQERGEKPSHGNSDAFKSAVKAGKKINKLNEDEEDQFSAELDGFADQLAAEIKNELEDHKDEIQKSEEEVNEIAGVIGILGYILLSNTVANMLSKFAKKQFSKRDWGKGEEAAKNIYDFTHKNEEAFKAPIKRIVGLFTKDEKKKKMISDILYAIVILLMAGQAGGNAVGYIKKAGYLKGGLYGLKAAVKGTEVATILKGVVADAVS